MTLSSEKTALKLRCLEIATTTVTTMGQTLTVDQLQAAASRLYDYVTEAES